MKCSVDMYLQCYVYAILFHKMVNYSTTREYILLYMKLDRKYAIRVTLLFQLGSENSDILLSNVKD